MSAGNLTILLFAFGVVVVVFPLIVVLAERSRAEAPWAHPISHCEDVCSRDEGAVLTKVVVQWHEVSCTCRPVVEESDQE